MRLGTVLAGAAAVAQFFTAAVQADPFPAGSAQRTLDIGGTRIEIYSYKPADYAGGPLLVSLHGLGRNAEGYRDYAVPLANQLGAVVIAPLFDRERFPTWRYQAGGLVRPQNRTAAGSMAVEPAQSWTGQLILRIVEAVRALEGRPELPYYLLGHSAGGQALSRLAAFAPNSARRILIANPSTYVWPDRAERFPYGFGGLPDALSDNAAIRRYLAQPVTVLLGTADVHRDPSLNVTAGAERQGPNRYERGLNLFRAARQAAADAGWEFNWRLVEAPGIGHSARRMYESPQAAAALLGTD